MKQQNMPGRDETMRKLSFSHPSKLFCILFIYLFIFLSLFVFRPLPSYSKVTLLIMYDSQTTHQPPVRTTRGGLLS